MGLFLNTQHWDSYTNAAVKRALVQGALYHTLRFCAAASVALPVVLLSVAQCAATSVVLPVVSLWATELHAHGYTRLY